jgi:ribonucleoside-triphosphate reductase
MSYVKERFILEDESIRNMTPNFGYGGFGEITYYRSYSRFQDGNQEHWADTVIRVINGVFSIRKDWYVRNRIQWKEDYWQRYAAAMAASMFRMEWLPPGRGLWAMGTDLIYERGSMALYNCAFTTIGKEWIGELCWLMDTLMYGVGVGFKPERTTLDLYTPDRTHTFVVPDTREGWVEGLRQLLLAFVETGSLPIFDYTLIRPKGALIKTFGGIASGPDPLREMYDKITELCYRYCNNPIDYDEVQFKTDLANLIGVCVVTGNVRRSAEIALCEFSDPVFMDLKNYDKHPERAAWGWMSNNSVILEKDEDFEHLDRIAQANINGHDVGYLNYRNLPHGRLGKHDDVKIDRAIGCNPCGEIPLESGETCNVVETLPTRCVDTESWLKACEYATFYASTVSLLPTHSHITNRVVTRNRRIGVSIIDFTGWKHQIGVSGVTAALRAGYNHIRTVNKYLAEEAGVPESIRVTTMKPGGTVPKMAGRTAGASHPTFHYTLRRIRIQAGTTLERLMIQAGIPSEPDHYSKNTTTFEYPIIQGPAVPATHVSIWEQAMNVVLLQREWADNMVSNTLYFKPKWRKTSRIKHHDGNLYTAENGTVVSEYQLRAFSHIYKIKDGWLYEFNSDHEEDQLEAVLAAIAPVTKSVSLLPHSETGFMPQMPEQGISKEEYESRIAAIKSIDWSKYKGSDGLDEKYCTGDQCELPSRS